MASSSDRKRPGIRRAAVALAFLLLAIPMLAGAAGKRVERWIGDITFQHNDDQGYICPSCNGQYEDSVVQRWDLQVFEEQQLGHRIGELHHDISVVPESTPRVAAAGGLPRARATTSSICSSARTPLELYTLTPR